MRYLHKYSSENQLVEVFFFPEVLSATPYKVVKYAYDPMGRRIEKKVVDNRSISDPQKTFTRRFVYDREDIISEIDEDGKVLARYTHMGLGTDNVLAVDISEDGVTQKIARNAGSYSFIKDHLGTIREIANNTGSIIQRNHYTAFGEVKTYSDENDVELADGPLVNSGFAFAGRELDSETGLYYNRARYYDPGLGRFIHQDPQIGSIDSPITMINKYIYGANNPLLFRDPSGQIIGLDDYLMFVIIGAIIGAIDASTRTGDIGAILSGAMLGAVAGFGIWLTAYIVPASTFFGALSVPNQWVGLGLAVAPALFGAATKGGSFVRNFANSVVNGDTIIAAGLAWMGEVGRTTLAPGLRSAEWAERAATWALYTYTYLLQYAPGLNELCNKGGPVKCN